MKGFFSLSKTANKKPCSGVARCGECGLAKNCNNPRMKPVGEGRKKILIVSEFPEKAEEMVGLIGKYGKLLKENLSRLNINLNKDCWRTFAIVCRPKDGKVPDDVKINACRPNLIKTIKELKPKVIILLGSPAAKSLLSFAWKEDIGSITRWAGYCIPYQKLNTWIVPTYHPSFLIRMESKVLNRLFLNHLRLAIKKRKNRPWEIAPQYKKEIEIITNPRKAALYIKEQIKKTRCIAFDYESTCLKPEYEGAEIVSNSVCFDGKKTIAYPFSGEAVDWTIKLLKKPIPKIASNLKFEERWTRFMLGFRVRKWYWDTMQAAHIIDNRKGITSVKFQSFVLLGAESYDEHITPYLKSGKEKINRIKEIDLEDLLLYNGMDSLVEYKVAMEQIKILNRR